MDIKIGQVVQSKAGRDANKYFIIVEKVDNQNVKIVDGKIRKIQNPKQKKIKHIKVTTAFANIQSFVTNDPNNLNALIRKELNRLGYSNKEE